MLAAACVAATTACNRGPPEEEEEEGVGAIPSLNNGSVAAAGKENWPLLWLLPCALATVLLLLPLLLPTSKLGQAGGAADLLLLLLRLPEPKSRDPALLAGALK